MTEDGIGIHANETCDAFWHFATRCLAPAIGLLVALIVCLTVGD
jgi:hypothetical protein